MTLRYETKNHIATFTLDNPPVNVWTPEQTKQFHDRLVEFLDDDDIYVGILTGAGDRAFSAGDDLKSPRPDWSEAELGRRYLNGMREGIEAGYPGWETKIAELPRTKPIIAAINGVTLGQGFVFMSMLTDIRIASEHAKFGLVEIAHGMGGAAGGLQLGNQMAHVDAMYLALTGEMITAQKACEMRLINEVVPAEQLMIRVQELAEKIASHPRLGVRVEMEAYADTKTMSRRQAIKYVSHMFRILHLTIEDPMPFSKKSGE